jgi:beta-xylosidase
MDWPRNKNFKGGPNSLQAPHCFTFEGLYYCFYNSGPARAMVSKDGIDWSVFRNTAGAEIIFDMGRDVMLFHDEAGKRWLACYCGAWTGGKGHGIVARTAPAPAGPWSKDAIPVKTDGNPESPFVLKRAGRYYLFQQMSVFVSGRADHFEGPPLTHMTGVWYGGKYAPEIIVDDGQYYLAGYSRGIWLARMKWLTMTPDEAREHAAPILEEVRKGREAARRREEERERLKQQRQQAQ